MPPTKESLFKVDDSVLENWLQVDIEAADRFFSQNLRDEIITRYRLVHADKEYYKEKFPRLSMKSSITTSDIHDTIEWILPSIIRIFWGGTDIVSISGRTQEDRAEVMKDLINFQILSQNKGFMIFYSWFKDCFEAGLGIVKGFWTREKKKQIIERDVTPEEFNALDPKEIMDAYDNPDGTIKVLLKTTVVVKNQPSLLNIPASQFIYLPQVNEKGYSPFVCHRRFVTADHLKRMEKAGIYTNVDEAMRSETRSGDWFNDLYDLDRHIKGFRETESDTDASYDNSPDKARKKYLIEECYPQYDVNNDGLLEDVILTRCGNTLIRKEDNSEQNGYGRPPFYTLTAMPRSYQIWGMGIADLLQDLQNLKTALIRQIIINIAQNNDRKTIIDEGQINGLEDLREDRSYVRIKDKDGRGIKNYIEFFPHDNLSPETFTFLEYLQGMIESKTGVTKYNQGLDASSLNKTAKGVGLIMNASQQRIELMARILAETGVVDLFQGLIAMNQKWMDQETVIRVTNKPLLVHPDDLQGTYDTVVAVGLGVGTKEQSTQNMMLLLNELIPKVFAPIGLAGPQEIFNAGKKLLEEMGYKSWDDFLRDPQQVAAMMQGVPGMLPQANAGQPPTPPTGVA